MMRKHSVKIIPALCCSSAALVLCAAAWGAGPAARSRTAARPATLAALVRSYRESRTPAAREAVEAYASAHPPEAGVASLALGIAAYEQKDYEAAARSLRGLSAKLPRLADYASYYLAAARVEAGDTAGVAQDLAPVHRAALSSPYAGRAWLLEARALKNDRATDAVKLLRDHYPELPQPEGDVVLADCYQAAGEPAHAVDFYQRVYYRFISGDAAVRAAAALLTLQDALGPAFPQPLPQQLLQRADRLLEAREYREARSAYETMAGQFTGLDRDQARVRMGAADFLSGNTAAAYPYLRGLDLAESEADAERLFYLEECARRLTDDDEMMGALKRLDKTYPHSPWRLKALLGAANRYLVVNQPDDYLPLYKAVYQDFPGEPAAASSHWKVAFQAYLNGEKDAPDLLREQLEKYPAQANAASALYFLARSAEAGQDAASAATYYQRLTQSFPNTYYGMLARQRLAVDTLATVPSAPQAAEFLGSVALPDAKPVPGEPTPATNARVDRARMLRIAGLNDLAEAELRFGARTDGQPALLAMEMAGAAEAPHQGLRMMKSLASDYLNLPLSGAPEKFWRLLFPLPYREDLVANARAKALDPYLVAGLIRQESEFNPQALSRANAYGLTQVVPGTGRQFARGAGVTRFTNRVLFQPAINLKIGTAVLRSMLDQNSGNLEQTLASYNAGPVRVSRWLSWRNYREPAEFVESIPFTETREYVQAVLRNADIYRRLYR